MDDVGFIFLMFLMVVGGTCSVALCVQVLQCCLLRFCDKKEKVDVLQIRSVSTETIIENPMTVQVEMNRTGIFIDEDPKN
jgi:hypothetical protein